MSSSARPRRGNRDIEAQAERGRSDADAITAWANMWRGIPDTDDEWSGVLRNAHLLVDSPGEDWRPHVRPGAWDDLDMLALGPQFKSSTECRPNPLPADEQITTMTAWALYPSPIMLSCNLATLTDFELRLFGNEEVIAVNQDRQGTPAMPLSDGPEPTSQTVPLSRKARIWIRALANGSIAVGLFNLTERHDALSMDLGDVGLSGSVSVRNLWERRDMGRSEGRLSIEVPAHGGQFVLLKKP